MKRCKVHAFFNLLDHLISYKKLPGVSGSMAYNLSVAVTVGGGLFHRLGKPMKVTFDDGEVIEERCMFSVFGNEQVYGGGYHAAPEAKLDDGLIDFCIVSEIGLLRIAKVIGVYKKGEHIIPKTRKIIKLLRCRTLCLEFPEERRVSIDGENGVPRTFDALGKVEADVGVDFSHHSAIADVLEYAKSIGCAAVIGTTGHTAEEKELIFAVAKEIPVFYSGNMSLGIAVLCRLAKQAAAAFPDADIEIVEVHHNRKVDAPSGTAHMIFNAIKEVRPNAYENCGRSGEGKRTKDEIGISALRMGNVVGIHEVHINTGTQTLVLKHESGSRAMLADGAVSAAKFMVGKEKGMYDMESILNAQ